MKEQAAQGFTARPLACLVTERLVQFHVEHFPLKRLATDVERLYHYFKGKEPQDLWQACDGLEAWARTNSRSESALP